MKKIRCSKCEHVVEHNDRRITGCVCDPDSPTWVAIQPNGVVLAFSHARYEIVEQ